jgi:hypothetical protein
MVGAVEIVQKFMGAIGKADFAAARVYLDDNLSFQGPLDTFAKAEPYLEALKRLGHIVDRVDVKKMFVDQDDVCLLYEMVTKTPAGTAFIAEWHRVKGGKIVAIRAVFDARPFAEMFAQ